MTAPLGAWRHSDLKSARPITRIGGSPTSHFGVYRKLILQYR
jgi:hypothetical protein